MSGRLYKFGSKCMILRLVIIFLHVNLWHNYFTKQVGAAHEYLGCSGLIIKLVRYILRNLSELLRIQLTVEAHALNYHYTEHAGYGALFHISQLFRSFNKPSTRETLLFVSTNSSPPKRISHLIDGTSADKQSILSTTICLRRSNISSSQHFVFTKIPTYKTVKHTMELSTDLNKSYTLTILVWNVSSLFAEKTLLEKYQE